MNESTLPTRPVNGRSTHPAAPTQPEQAAAIWVAAVRARVEELEAPSREVAAGGAAHLFAPGCLEDVSSALANLAQAVCNLELRRGALADADLNQLLAAMRAVG